MEAVAIRCDQIDREKYDNPLPLSSCSHADLMNCDLFNG